MDPATLSLVREPQFEPHSRSGSEEEEKNSYSYKESNLDRLGQHGN
jgi:hypothetical protein